MNKKITIIELVANGTITSDMAAFLWQAVDEKVSFLTSAVYQNAGKTTVTKAILDLLSSDVPLHYVADTIEVTEKLLKIEPPGGYLIVSEFSAADAPGYIYGSENVQKIFDLIKNGYSLQGCIHADNGENAISSLQAENGLADEDVSKINMVVHLDMFGTNFENVQRRLTEIYEVHYVENSKVFGHPIYLWNDKTDSFDYVSDPHNFARDKDLIKKRKVIIDSLVGFGKATSEDISKAVEEFNRHR